MKTVAGGTNLDVTVDTGAGLDLSGGLDNAAGITTTFTGTVSVGAITGSGSTEVAASSSLSAASIVQNTLTIGAGGSVTIRETPVAAGGAAGQCRPRAGYLGADRCRAAELACVVPPPQQPLGDADGLRYRSRRP